MNYSFRESTIKDKELLTYFKLNTIFEYAKNVSEEEKNKIISYVNSNIANQIKNYKLIIVNNKVVGGLLAYNHDDGILLDEIYIEHEYRNNHIGSSIISDLINKNNVIYLWVYKENLLAIKLYKRLGFNINKETETRYFMKYVKGDN